MALPDPQFTRRTFIKASTAAAIAAPAAGCTEFSDKPTAQAVPDTPIPTTSSFTGKSTAMQVTEGLDLTGKNILITGCNSGIGYETMRVLSHRGAHVLGTGRTLAKAEEACASIDGNTTPLECELTDFDNVAACAVFSFRVRH
jgi:NADPH:quinone reductase-like Zn-dependent oxidoreductase